MMQGVIAATATAAAASEAAAPEAPRIPPPRPVRTNGSDAQASLSAVVPGEDTRDALRSPHRAGKDQGWLQTIFGIGPEIHGACVPVPASSWNVCWPFLSVS